MVIKISCYPWKWGAKDKVGPSVLLMSGKQMVVEFTTNVKQE